MTITVNYPYDRLTLEPLPLKASWIWNVADDVRRQIMAGRRGVGLDLDRVVRVPLSMRVNGTTFAARWHLDRRIADGQGREALGVLEADPQQPGVVTIGLNADLVADRDYLKRSTLAHELGHAVFDGPALLRIAGKPAFATVIPDEGHLSTYAQLHGQIDWREFRANEFMGALLVPRGLLHRELVRRAIALGLSLTDGGEYEPLLKGDGDPARFEALLFDLAERFGVSANFIDYRLRRYALVR